MTTYAAEFKEHLVAKMLPPNHVSVPQLVRETGIPRPLYGWRRQAVGFWAFASDHRDRLADTCQPRELLTILSPTEVMISFTKVSLLSFEDY